MTSKICFKCNIDKPLDDYYDHQQMSDGHLNKCKDCTKKDTKAARVRTVSQTCAECNKTFMAVADDIKRGNGKFCSRVCFYEYQPKMLEEKWKGNRGYYALHQWVQRQLGKPSLCEFCKTTEGKFEWSNVSGKYLEELTDWQRLCIKCHRKYDHIGVKAWATRRKNMSKAL